MAFSRVPVAGAALILQVLFSTGCAKMGDPQPPLVLVSKPGVDLAARQYSDKVVLTLSVPLENTDGSPATTLAKVEVFRLVDDKTDNPAQLEEGEFLKRAQPLLTIPAQNLSKYTRDRTLVFEDNLAFADRAIIYHKGFRYAARFVNKKHQTAGLSNQAYLAPVPIPEPPTGLSAELGQDRVRIRWADPTHNMDGSVPPRMVGYNVYRTEDPQVFSPAPLNRDPLRIPEFEDRNFEFDKTYYFAVSVVGNTVNPYAESLPSALLAVQTKDSFAPGAPLQLHALVDKGIGILLWTAPPENDVAGYRIYRMELKPAGRGELLQQELMKTLSYRDEKVESGRKYHYSVTAVDTHGNEGPAATTTVDIP